MLMVPTLTPELARQHQAHKARERRMERPARPIGASPRVDCPVVAELPQPVHVEIEDHQPDSTTVEVILCNRQVVYLDLAKLAEERAAAERGAGHITLDAIQRAACIYFGASRIDLLSPRRDAAIVRTRQVAMYLARKLTMHSMPKIGQRFGGRDHTTVIHAVRKISALIAQQDPVINDIKAVEVLLLEGTSNASQ